MTKDNFKILFGKNLQKLRTDRGLSYRSLAERCDVDASDISKCEKAKIAIQLGTVLELAKGLDIHPKTLFDFELDIDIEIIK